MVSPRRAPSWIVVVTFLAAVSVVLAEETTLAPKETTTVEAAQDKPLSGPEALVCFLRRKPSESCTDAVLANVTAISARIKHLYSKMNKSLREFISNGSLADAPPEIFSEIHSVVFYLMPHGDKRLRAGGQALAQYVRVRNGDTAAIIASAAQLEDVESRDLFVSKLSGVLLPERSQSVLGEYLTEWFPTTDDWKSDRFGKMLKAGNPLAGSLPPPFLTSLPPVTIERFLFLLSHWETFGVSRGDLWWGKGKVVTRTWAQMIMKSQHPHHISNWKTLSYQRYCFLLLGFTPDELLNMSVPHREVWSSIFNLKFERLQVRAVFQAIVGNGTNLKEDDLRNGIPVFAVPALHHLSPHQLATNFNHSIADFTVINYQSAKKFENPTLATALQLSNCLIAQSMHTKLANSSSKGNETPNGKPEPFAGIIMSVGEPSSSREVTVTLDSFINVGCFAYSLPISFFLNKNITRIQPQFLKDIDSNELSLMQGHLLTRHLVVHLGSELPQPPDEIANGSFSVSGDDIITFGPGLLRGLLSSSSIAALDMQKVPQKVIQHLLDVDKPWKMQREGQLSLRSLVILQKIQNELSEPWVLKHILDSGASAQILRYLPPQELSDISRPIVAESSFTTLSGLHETSLATLLDVAMPELKLRGAGNGKWSSEALTPRALPLLRGMRCSHLELADPLDIIVVLGQYNKQRRGGGSTKYQPFPKNLQNCANKALASHLELKAALWSGTNVDFSIPNILQVLEDSDIESIGGFVIAGLPEQVLDYLGADALRLVGQLSSEELLCALDGKHHPSDIALLLLKQLGMISDLEIAAVSVEERGGRKYSVGRLGAKWSEWSGRKGSLLPLLFGSLMQFLPPDLVDASSLRWMLETASTTGGALVCLDARQRHTWYSTLKEAFGPPEKWTGSLLATIGDFLLVVPQEALDQVPKMSWVDAADTLTENTRYFTRNLETPSGYLSYSQVCAGYLTKAEVVKYVGVLKGLARCFLQAAQWQLESVMHHWEILRRMTPSTVDAGEMVRVPGLRRPSLSGHHDSPQSDAGKPSRKERASDGSSKSDGSSDTKVTCSAIRAVGPEVAAFALTPRDIELMSPQEVSQCVDILGVAQLEEDVLWVVWAKAKQSGLSLRLEDLGRIASVMSLKDLLAFNATVASNLDAVSVMGREFSKWEMVSQLAERVLAPNGGEAIGVEAAGAMGGLLCGVPLERLPRPQVMLRAVPLVSEALGWGLHGGRGCPPEQCLRALARVASAWLGKPKKESWKATDLAYMGILAAGLDAEILNSLAEVESPGKQYGILSGLQTSALDCMPESVLKSLGRAHVLQLSQLAATALRARRSDALTEDSRSTLDALAESPFDRLAFQELGIVVGNGHGGEAEGKNNSTTRVMGGGGEGEESGSSSACRVLSDEWVDICAQLLVVIILWASSGARGQ